MTHHRRHPLIFLPLLVLAAACGTVSEAEPEANDRNGVGGGAGLEVSDAAAPVCDIFTETEAPTEDTIRAAHEAGNTEYGAGSPSEILSRMGAGRDPVSNQEGDGPPPRPHVAFLQQFEDTVSAQSTTLSVSDRLEFTSADGRGTLEVHQVADRWFPVAWSIPIDCSPFDFPPDDTLQSSTLSAEVQPEQARVGDVVELQVGTGQTVRSESKVEPRVSICIWSDQFGWEATDEAGELQFVIEDDWPSGHYLVCLTEVEQAECGALEVVE